MAVRRLPRPHLGDTLLGLQRRSLALDWAVENRWTQPVTGQTCHFDQDGRVVRLWTCTAAGDVYVQRLGTDAGAVEEPPSESTRVS